MMHSAWHLGTALSAALLLVTPTPTAPASARGGFPMANEAGGPPDTLVANPRATSIRWKGTAVAGRAAQEGSVALASGMFVLRHERLTSGSFVIDMRSLAMGGTGVLHPASARTYLAGPAWFDVGRYPAATFTSSGMQRVGPSRWRVSGALTMHGVTRPLTFDTDVQWAEPGHMTAETTFSVDRRAFGVGGEGTSVVDDTLTVTVRLDAQRKAKPVAARAETGRSA